MQAGECVYRITDTALVFKTGKSGTDIPALPPQAGLTCFSHKAALPDFQGSFSSAASRSS
jgi:hypothetical protein